MSQKSISLTASTWDDTGNAPLIAMNDQSEGVDPWTAVIEGDVEVAMLRESQLGDFLGPLVLIRPVGTGMYEVSTSIKCAAFVSSDQPLFSLHCPFMAGLTFIMVMFRHIKHPVKVRERSWSWFKN